MLRHLISILVLPFNAIVVVPGLLQLICGEKEGRQTRLGHRVYRDQYDLHAPIRVARAGTAFWFDVSTLQATRAPLDSPADSVGTAGGEKLIKEKLGH